MPRGRKERWHESTDRNSCGIGAKSESEIAWVWPWYTEREMERVALTGAEKWKPEQTELERGTTRTQDGVGKRDFVQIHSRPWMACYQIKRDSAGDKGPSRLWEEGDVTRVGLQEGGSESRKTGTWLRKLVRKLRASRRGVIIRERGMVQELLPGRTYRW